jgi:hypothetical protein
VSKHSSPLKTTGFWIAATVLVAALIWMTNPGALQWLEPITIAKVPVPILLKFLGDKPARDAYFQKDKRALHDRLVALGVEEEIKAFYRSQIRDEVELDRYIHQIFYERSGYIGEAYTVNAEGILVLKQVGTNNFEEWLRLAQEVGLVAEAREENGVQYVISPAGTVAPYAEIAAIFPLAELRSLAAGKPQP